MKINPKQLEKMAKRMGIQASPIDAEEVIIRTAEKEIIISSPQVSKVNMMGQETWQITGEAEERSKKAFNDEDIDTVLNQTGASRDEVEAALEAAHGDLAQAIMRLKEEKE